MNDKIRVAIMWLLTLSVLIGLGAYLKVSVDLNDFASLWLVLPAVLIVVFFIPVFVRNYKSVKAGLPLEDERSRKVITNAAAKAFYLSLYWILAIGWVSDSMIQFRDVSQAMSVGILGMAISFAIFYFYYDRKGDL